MFTATITDKFKADQGVPDYSLTSSDLNQIKTFVKYNLPSFDTEKMKVGVKVMHGDKWILRVNKVDEDLPEDLPDDLDDPVLDDQSLGGQPIKGIDSSSKTTLGSKTIKPAP